MRKLRNTVGAGEFKAKCLQLMDEVSERHVSYTITKRGKPIAKLVPIEETPIDFFGCLKDTVTITGDIVSSVEVEWEANK